MADHRRVRRARRIVFLREGAAERGVHADQRQRAVGDVQRLDPFGLAATGNRDRHVVPQADVLEDFAVLAICEISRRRLIHRTRGNAGRDVPHADEALGIGQWQWLQQDAVDDAENQGVGADGGGEGEGRGQREGRRRDQASEGVPHSLSDGIPGLFPDALIKT